jgi:hypothetical protein
MTNVYNLNTWNNLLVLIVVEHILIKKIKSIVFMNLLNYVVLYLVIFSKHHWPNRVLIIVLMLLLSNIKIQLENMKILWDLILSCQLMKKMLKLRKKKNLKNILLNLQNKKIVKEKENWEKWKNFSEDDEIIDIYIIEYNYKINLK